MNDKQIIARLHELTVEWDRLKELLYSHAKMKRRMKLLQKNELTDDETVELARLQEWSRAIPTGALADQEINQKLRHAVDLLVAASKDQEDWV